MIVYGFRYRRQPFVKVLSKCCVFHCFHRNQLNYDFKLIFHTPYFLSMAIPGPRQLILLCNLFFTGGQTLGRVINPSRGLCLNTGQQRHRINAYTQPILCPEWDSNPRSQRSRESEDSLCLRPSGYCNRFHILHTNQ
jgi:hypothetical protein